MMLPMGGSPAGSRKPHRKPLQYDVQGFEEWKAGAGKEVEEDDAAAEYIKFKTTVTKAQMHGIFDDNKDRLWFAEQYHPDNYDTHQAKLKAAAASRLEVFNTLLAEGRLDKITWKPDSRKRLELLVKDINHLLDLDDQLGGAEDDATDGDAADDTEVKEAVVADDAELDFSAEPVSPSKRRLSTDVHTLQMAASQRTFSVELFFPKPLPEAEMKTALKAVGGFKRLSIASACDSSPLKLHPGARKVWATFSGVPVKTVEKELGEIKFDDKPLKFLLANRNLEPIRARETCILVASDKELAEKIIGVLDKIRELTDSNPFKAEEDVSLGKMVLYLRVVHSYDFFSGQLVAHEDGLAQRMGFMTVPNVGVFMGTPEDSWRDNGWAVADHTDEFKDFPGSTGTLTEETAVNDLVERNTKKIKDELYLCPLSGKKFKAPSFIRKHIMNKHAEVVEKARGVVGFFNNYVMDIFRCRTLPVAAQRPVGANGGMLRPPMMPRMMGGGLPMGMMPPPIMRDPNKDEFGRDIPTNRRKQRRDAPPPREIVQASTPIPSIVRNRPTYGDLF